VRYPVYAASDIVVDSADGPPEMTLDRVLQAFEDHLDQGSRLPKAGE